MDLGKQKGSNREAVLFTAYISVIVYSKSLLSKYLHPIEEISVKFFN